MNHPPRGSRKTIMLREVMRMVFAVVAAALLLAGLKQLTPEAVRVIEAFCTFCTFAVGLFMGANAAEHKWGKAPNKEEGDA